MPLYDYQCRACSKVTEVRHGFRESYDGVCPKCGGALARVFNAAGIVFKGSGFYVTDSRKAPSDGAAASKPDAPAGSSGESKTTDSAPKSDTTPKSDSAPKSESAPKPKSESSAA